MPKKNQGKKAKGRHDLSSWFTTGKAANGIMLDILVNPKEEEKEHWINKYLTNG